MAGEFLSEEQTASYGRFVGPLGREELERFFFLDDADRAVVARRRGDRNRLGFGVQLGTVRALGTFLADPLDVPVEAVDYVAGQVGVADPSSVKAYGERDKTRLEHQWEITREYGYTDFGSARADLAGWVDHRAWTTDEGPRALFVAAVGWLREQKVLLPGLMVLARLVAGVREAATERLYATVSATVNPEQERALAATLEVPEKARVSRLDGWRHGPRAVTGKGMVSALERVGEVAALGMRHLDLEAVPPRRLAALGRYGMAAKAPALRRHPRARRTATLVATMRLLEGRAVDDALELFDVLMTHVLAGRAEREARAEKLRRYPHLSKQAARLAAAVEVLLEATEWAEGEQLPLDLVWDAIENVVSRAELRTAVETITDTLPPPDADPDGEWRAAMIERYAVVRGFVPQLARTIGFGASTEAAPVLAAVQALPELLAARPTRKVPTGWLDARTAAVDVVPGGWWSRLVLPPQRPQGTVARAAYVFCVLELFHRGLKRRDIYAPASTRWRDPRGGLLAGAAWEQAKPTALSALQLPEQPDQHLAEHAGALDAAWRHVAAGVTDGDEVRLDEQGRLHAAAVRAMPDPPSLIDLRTRLEAMLPRVDLPELILEVMAWQPGFLTAFGAVSGAQTRLADLHVSVTAALCAHALNVGYTPIVADTPALTRDRLSHVDLHYLRPENYAAANAVLINAQADLDLAQAWGGGLVAAVDGMRFVAPVPTVAARPNPKYFGRGKGVTWLNAVSDHGVGIAGQVVSGTPRDSLRLIDLIYAQDGGTRPEVLVTDTGSYSDLVFGLVSLLGFDYRPQLADLPDAKLWRIDPAADYGPLDPAARGRIDFGRVRACWPDMLRVAGSVHTGAVTAHDVITVLSRGGTLTQLGDAIAHYGRIFKTLHVLSFVDDEPYRRGIKAMRNLQEGRHALARHIAHGHGGELRQGYQAGMEDQLGALGLVLNCVTLWNSVYLDAAVAQLRAQGYPVLDTDLARVSPYLRGHLNVHGHYVFALPELGGHRRALREPDTTDDR